jgi:transposase
VQLPWAEPRSRFTLLFERLAIDVLKEATVLGATRILRISWDEAWHLMQRAVTRGLHAKPKRVPAYLGVEEKAIAKFARYVTLVCDLDAATVEYVAEDRPLESLDSYFRSLPAAELEGIRAIAMDVWPPYIYSTLRQVPGARVAFRWQGAAPHAYRGTSGPAPAPRWPREDRVLGPHLSVERRAAVPVAPFLQRAAAPGRNHRLTQCRDQSYGLGG